MFGLALAIAVTLMQLYVFWRAASIPLFRKPLPRRAGAAIGCALWAALLFGRSVPAGDASVGLEALGMIWMAALFLTATALLGIDLATGFGLLFPRLAPVLRTAALVAGVLLSGIALVQGLRAPVVTPYEVVLADLPPEADGTVIVALSDLHLGALLGESWLDARVRQVHAERPDAIVLLGDTFEGHGTPDPALLDALRRLSAPLGVWAVLGNHEYYGGNDHDSLFERAGLRLLRNRWVELRPGLVLAGIEDPAAGHAAALPAVPLASALAGRPRAATVLLDHAPPPRERIAGNRVDLLLCGHTHSGQIWPFGYLVELRFPLVAGRYEVDGTTVIVSRGTGTWGPPMRLWRPGEILRVTLHRATP